MAKITRKLAKIFGINSAYHQMGVFGSLAAGSPAWSTDPTTVQSLANWLDGWYSAVLGNNSPAIEDMNAVCFVLAYQIAYQMQQGVPEWDSATAYFVGSLVSDGSGNIFNCIADNTGQPLTNSTYWIVQDSQGAVVNYTSGTYVLAATYGVNYIVGNTGVGNINLTLPDTGACVEGTEFVIKNLNSGSGNSIVLSAHAGQYVDFQNPYGTNLANGDSIRVKKTGGAWIVI